MFPALDRVFKAAGCRTQVELADFLGITQSSISDAKRRKSIPAEWLLALVLHKGIHPHWILTGEGPRLMRPVDASGAVLPEPARVTKVKPPEQCTMEELVAEIVRRALAAM